jgi:ribosomal protein S25
MENPTLDDEGHLLPEQEEPLQDEPVDTAADGDGAEHESDNATADADAADESLIDELTGTADNDDTSEPSQDDAQAEESDDGQPEAEEAPGDEDTNDETGNDGEEESSVSDEEKRRWHPSARKLNRKLEKTNKTLRKEIETLQGTTAKAVASKYGLNPEVADHAFEMLGKAVNGDPQGIEALAGILQQSGYQAPAPQNAIDHEVLRAAIDKVEEDFDFDALRALIGNQGPQNVNQAPGQGQQQAAPQAPPQQMPPAQPQMTPEQQQQMHAIDEQSHQAAIAPVLNELNRMPATDQKVYTERFQQEMAQLVALAGGYIEPAQRAAAAQRAWNAVKPSRQQRPRGQQPHRTKTTKTTVSEEDKLINSVMSMGGRR